ncbi:hypothetical protein [Albimonas pacifica]|uniref:Tyr recombinase domain-containing protein n=1 Tax=Albimonas pacifica TaxID=1114924 RepID=A0A1I3HKP8_9RHOB|nr:hypothetical protein [Albimonas pacifica]SFI36315.1 hypothetical protein SAMN05216258_10651 [Albimonas pacifica]
MKPAGWPRYMREKRLAGGATAYFWEPPGIYRKAGLALRAEPLGRDYAAAVTRAEILNAEVDAWRKGRGGEKVPQGVGTLRWCFHVYQTESLSWRENVSERSRGEYARNLRMIAEMPLERPARGLATVGDLPLAAITPAAADRIYSRLRVKRIEREVDGRQVVEEVPRLRQAHLALDIARRAWSVVARVQPEHFPKTPAGFVAQPFHGIERIRSPRKVKPAATLEEAYALAAALRDMGHPHLGAAALIAFEWVQRPENILAGWIRWTDYAPGERAMILHHKTGERVEHPLSDEDGSPLYPELEAWLADLDVLGVSIVLQVGARGPGKGKPRPYDPKQAAGFVRQARKAAGLGDHVTLDACRHGGLTELGDAEVTEAEGMATSGHKTPSAYRGYVKRTAAQRLSAARKRRAWRESGG